MQHAELIDFVVDKLDDMKGLDIKTLDVTGKSNVTDTLVFCSGTSKRHVLAIARNLANEARGAGLALIGVEGEDTGEWVLVDLGETVVHVMQEPVRDYYQLEKLWS